MATIRTERDRAGDAASRALISRIDAAGWGVFLVWVGVALAADVGWGIALMGTGLISLAAQAARKWRALPIDRWSVGFGGCLAVVGFLLWLGIPLAGAALPRWAFPAAFVVTGLAVMVRAWIRKDQ